MFLCEYFFVKKSRKAKRTACRCYCKILYENLLTFVLLFVIKLQKLFDMTKPRLVKVRASFYVFQHIAKNEAAPILNTPSSIFNVLHLFGLRYYHYCFFS